MPRLAAAHTLLGAADKRATQAGSVAVRAATTSSAYSGAAVCRSRDDGHPTRAMYRHSYQVLIEVLRVQELLQPASEDRWLSFGSLHCCCFHFGCWIVR